MPSSGLISFHGVGFFVVHWTGGVHSGVRQERGKVAEEEGKEARTGGAACGAEGEPGAAGEDNADDGDTARGAVSARYGLYLLGMRLHWYCLQGRSGTRAKTVWKELDTYLDGEPVPHERGAARDALGMRHGNCNRWLVAALSVRVVGDAMDRRCSDGFVVHRSHPTPIPLYPAHAQRNSAQ